MNNDLISRAALLKELDLAPDEWAKGRTIHGIIAEAPAVDAEPARHGRWIEYTYWIGAFGQIHTKCSECGTDYPCRKGGRGDGKGGKFCEECGAKMDLKEDTNG
jgi:hypothetical protein